jgi:hypothetical protein
LIPFNGIEIPFNGIEIPFNGIVIPFNGIVIPFNGIVIPFNGIVIPFNGIVIPFNGIEIPFNGTEIPSNRMKIPLERMKISVNRMKILFERTKISFDGRAIAFDQTVSPFDGVRVGEQGYFDAERRGRCFAAMLLMTIDRRRLGSSGTLARASASEISLRTSGASRSATSSMTMWRTRVPLPRRRSVGSGSFTPFWRKKRLGCFGKTAMETMASEARSLGAKPIASAL